MGPGIVPAHSKSPPAILQASPVTPTVGTRGTPTSWHHKTFTHSVDPSLGSSCGPGFVYMWLRNCCHPICPGPGFLCPHNREAEDFLSHHVGEQKTTTTVITFQVLLNRVQGGRPLGFLPGHPRTAFYTEGLGSRLRSGKPWPAPYPTLVGNVRHLAGPPCFQHEGLASEKCCQEKGSVLRRKTREALRSFNIPCPTASSPSKPLPRFLPPPQKNPFISHFPMTYSWTKSVSAQIHTGRPAKAVGSVSALGAF